MDVYNFEVESQISVLMECLDSDLCQGFIELASKDFSEYSLKYILFCVLTAISLLHENNIIHRGIRAENVLYNSAGEIKLAGFSSAVQNNTQQSSHGDLIGDQFNWMAPEILSQESDYSMPVDIWSFGCFALELVDRKIPFGSAKMGQINDMI
jgi:serine/threonine-protein kinase 24/25/MST4